MRHDLAHAADSQGDDGQHGQYYRPAFEQGVQSIDALERPGGVDRCFKKLAGRRVRGQRCGLGEVVFDLTAAGGHDHVDHAEDCTAEIEQARDRAHQPRPPRSAGDLKPVTIDEVTVLIEGQLHESLGDAADPQRHGIEGDTEGRDPEMNVGEVVAPHFAVLGPPDAGDEPVDHAEDQKTVPAQGAAMDMADDPVGVVAEGVDLAQRQEGAFEGRHAVECHGCHVEFEHRRGAHLIKGAAQGQQTVDHPAPGRRDQHDTEHHAQALGPLWGRLVEQVVRSGPDVQKDQRPEVHDG